MFTTKQFHAYRVNKQNKDFRVNDKSENKVSVGMARVTNTIAGVTVLVS